MNGTTLTIKVTYSTLTKDFTKNALTTDLYKNNSLCRYPVCIFQWI